MTNQLVTCEHHGRQRAAVVCDHIAQATSADFLVDPADELFGVCPACATDAARHGRYSKASFTDRAVACESCFHVIRGRLQSLDVPPTGDINDFMQAVTDEMVRRNTTWFSAAVAERLPQWELTDDSSGIIFRDREGNPQLLARVVPVGTYSYESDSWAWSWANPAVPALLRAQAHVIQGVGLRLELPPLVEPQLPLPEDMAFGLAMLGAWANKAHGWYRFHQDHLHHYLAVFDIRPTH
ncbi:MAG: hypothetical protein RIF41_37720 [Polyangiaceae bacterium]